MLVSAAAGQDAAAQVTNDVQAFYDSYTLLAGSSTGPAPWIEAIARNSSEFSGSLILQLKQDYDAQRADPGDIVGLDFDPFLFGQDFFPKYHVVLAGNINGRYFLDVFGIKNDKPVDKPSVIP